MLLQEIVTFTSTAINLFSWLHRRDGIFSKAWTSRHKGGGGRETASNALWNGHFLLQPRYSYHHHNPIFHGQS